MNDHVLPTVTGLSPAWVNSLIVIGAVALVALAILIWAIAFHKRGTKRQHHHHRHHHHQHGGFREDFKKTTAGIKEIIHQRQHQHRHKHRPINPTLAQTGGLPPIREESKPPPPTP